MYSRDPFSKSATKARQAAWKAQFRAQQSPTSPTSPTSDDGDMDSVLTRRHAKKSVLEEKRRSSQELRTKVLPDATEVGTDYPSSSRRIAPLIKFLLFITYYGTKKAW